MRKDINDYRLYVFDLDGTLYDQPKMRLIMAMRLALYYALHPFSAGDLILLQHFRKVKDSRTADSSDEDVIAAVAKEKNADPERVRRIIKKWIYDNPLSALDKVKDTALIAWMEDLKKSGKKVVIFSDYPSKDKLEAMSVAVDGMYDPEDPRIDEQKPSPKGLQVIMEDTGIAAKDILMIGDRMEKDGASAASCGIDHLILPRNVGRRKHYEKRS
ncbi:MAG: HAD-IA family hydrolase [Lachnospiraceae bacterium]|nr:HAD-IA family hydrolase [Lachnospiraceae bacterium]